MSGSDDILKDHTGRIIGKVIHQNYNSGRFVCSCAVIYGKKDKIKFSELGDKW